MKKIIFIFACLLHVIGIKAQDFEYEGIWYSIISEEERTAKTKEGIYTSRHGDTAFHTANWPKGFVKIPEEVPYMSNWYRVVEIGFLSFGYYDWMRPNYKGNDELTGVELPSTVKKIDDLGFSWAVQLKTVSNLQNMEFIGWSAFDRCNLQGVLTLDSIIILETEAFLKQGFSEVVIGEKAERIKLRAFQDNSNLRTIVFKSSPVLLDGVFSGCEKIESIYCFGEPPRIEKSGRVDLPYEEPFPEKVVASATVYVPRYALEAYENDNYWGRFCKIEPLDISGVGELSADKVCSPFEVYTLSGRKVLTAGSKEEMDHLPSGIYVVNGKKIMVTAH